MTFPASPAWLDATSLYERLEFPPAPDGRPYVAVNMVSTVDGKATVAGRAADIGSPTDRLMMRRLRAAVDCVLVGAGTVRAEAFDVRASPEEQAARIRRGLSPQPLVGIVTNTGDLPYDRRALLRGREPRPLVIASDRALRAHPERFARAGEVATVISVGVEAPDMPRLARVLRGEYGVERLLVEGGPALNQALFAAGLVDELFLTLAPRIVGGRGKSIVEDDVAPRLDLARLALVSVAAADGELYLRYRVRGTG